MYKNKRWKGVYKINNIILDNKNKRAWIKKQNNKKMTKQEKKRYYRTKRIINKAEKKIDFNQKNEDEINRLFF